MISAPFYLPNLFLIFLVINTNSLYSTESIDLDLFQFYRLLLNRQWHFWLFTSSSKRQSNNNCAMYLTGCYKVKLNNQNIKFWSHCKIYCCGFYIVFSTFFPMKKYCRLLSVTHLVFLGWQKQTKTIISFLAQNSTLLLYFILLVYFRIGKATCYKYLGLL